MQDYIIYYGIFGFVFDEKGNFQKRFRKEANRLKLAIGLKKRFQKMVFSFKSVYASLKLICNTIGLVCHHSFSCPLYLFGSAIFLQVVRGENSQHWYSTDTHSHCYYTISRSIGKIQGYSLRALILHLQTGDCESTMNSLISSTKGSPAAMKMLQNTCFNSQTTWL